MSVVNMTVGGVTPTTARFAAKVTAGPNIRIAVSGSSSMTSPTFYGPVAVDGQKVAKVTATGLSPNTRYWWRVEDNGTIDTSFTGQFKTFPPVGEPASFTIAAATCAGLTPDFPGVGSVLASNRLTNHPVFDTIRNRALAEDWLFFGHLGDLSYYDIGSGAHVPDHTITTYRRQIDDVLLQPRQHELYRSVPWVYTWDDHCWGPDNSDGTHPGGPNAQQAYREKIPHYTLPLSSGPIYHSFQIGRVLFIVADTRSARTPNSATDNASKTMLGSAQKAWMANLLQTTDAEFVCWLMSSLWAGWTTDSWMVFTTERNELIQMFGDTGWLKRMLIVSGDAHELGIDTGGNSPGGIPLFQFASLDARPAGAHDLYDLGTTSPGRNRYGTIKVEDSGTRLFVTGTGYIGETPWKSHTVATAPAPLITPTLRSALTGPVNELVEAKVVDRFQVGPDPEGLPIKVLGGDVLFDSTAEVFSSLTLETEGHDGRRSLFPRRSSDPLAPYGNEVFVRRGVDLGETVLWFPLGYFRIDDVEQPGGADAPIRISGQDRMAGIRDGNQTRPRQLNAHRTVGSAIHQLVTAIYPLVTMQYDDTTNQQELGRQIIVEEDRLAALFDIVESVGKIVFFDSDGILRITDAPDPDVIVWSVKAGRAGVLVEPGRSVSRRGMANGVVARGEGITEGPVRAVVVDDGPHSPTRWFPPEDDRLWFGQVPITYESPLLTTYTEAAKAARAILRRRVGMPYSANFGSVVNPALRPWDVIRVTQKDGNREKHFVETLRIPLTTGSPMTGTTREQTFVVTSELRVPLHSVPAAAEGEGEIGDDE